MSCAPRVLIVEDHVDSGLILDEMLQAAHFDPVVVTSGKQALEEFGKHKFDLILCDIVLPDISGWELLPQLHQLRFVPALAFTGMGYKTDVEKSRLAGFQAHLLKPASPTLLIEALKKLLP